MGTSGTPSESTASLGTPASAGVRISGESQVTARDIIGRDQYIGYTSTQVTLLLDKIRTEYQVKPFDGRSPYVGLTAFQERDADRFFGRETLTAELVARVASSAESPARAVFVAGPSGSGKSSLVRAGLVPALKKGKVPGSEHWLYGTLKPERTPLENLARVVSDFRNSPEAGQDLLKNALTDPARLHYWMDIVLGDDSTRRAVIVIDQFEEMFTQLSPERESERVAFLNLLTYAATVPNGRTLVLFTLRSDFVANCASYPNLNALVNQQFIQVGAMTPDELVSAISRPAYQVGLRVDPALIAQIVNDVRGEPGALPLMQFALKDLFEAEKSKGELTLEGYTARGGLHEALERHADAEFAKLDDAEKQLARTVFSGLIEIGRGHEDTKRTALFSELVPKDVPASHVLSLVRELADARLITTDEQDGKEIVTLAHERLIDAWGWLRKLVDENRDAIALQNEISQDAQEWEKSDRDESYLYRGARLATAREKLDQNKLVLSGLAQEFVETAITARETARQREQARTRRLLIGFGAAALVFAVLAILSIFLWRNGVVSEQRAQAESTRAVEQKQLADAGATAAVAAQSTAQAERQAAEDAQAAALDAADVADTAAREAGRQQLLAETARETAVAGEKIANSRALAVIASGQLEQNPELALAIALEANRDTTTFEANDVLRRALRASRLRGVLRGTADRLETVALSPDGNRALTADSARQVHVWDTGTGNQLFRVDGFDDAQFSKDGNLFLTRFDGRVRLWDANTFEEKVVLELGALRIDRAMFTPDGSRVVTLVCEQTTEFTCNESIHVWDLNGNQLVELRPEDGVSDLTVSPDNQRLIVTGYRDVPKIWDMNTGVELGPLQGTQTAADNAQFSPDGTRLLTSIPTSAAEGGGLHLLNASDGKEIARFDAGYGHFSPDGKRLVLGGFGQSTTVWDIAAAKQIASVKNLPGTSGHAQFSPDGKWILDPSYDITRIWDASTGEILFKVKGDSFTLPSFSADGTRIITSDRDGTALIWTAALDEELLEFDYYDQNARAEISPDKARLLTSGCIQNGTAGCTEALARIRNVTDGGLTTTLRWQDDTSIDVLFSPTGDRLLTIGCTEFNTFGSCANASVRLWDVLGGNQLARLDKQGFFVDTYWPNDDPLLLIQHCPQSPQTDSCSDWVVEVWDIPSGEERVRLEGNTGRVQAAKYANDGTRIVTASNDGTVRTWDAASGKMLSMWKAHAVGAWRAHFLHGHSLVLTNGCESLRGNGMQCQSVGYKLWNANTGAVVAKLKGGSVDTIAYVSPNEEWIAIEGPDNLLLYKARAGEHYATLERTSSIETAVFNADNTHLLTASTDGTARIWDLATAKELVRFRGHTGSIISADFSFDESLVVTTSGDGTVRIWDARTSAERAVLRSGIGDFVSATILPGNKYVLVGVGDDDRTFSRLFLVQPDDIVALARSRNFHQFTCAERETFLHEREACANATSTP